MEKTQIVFRSAINGYNRDDVNKYILETSKKFKEAQEASKEKIEILTAKLAKLESHDVTKTEELQKNVESLTSTVQSLKEENDKLKADLAAATVNSEKTGEAAGYDALSQQIGSILISANTTASTILSNASSDAEKLRADAENELFKVKMKISAEAESVLSKFTAEMTNVLDQCITELQGTVSAVQSETAAITTTIEQKNKEMNEKVECYKKLMRDSLAVKLADMQKGFDQRSDGSK